MVWMLCQGLFTEAVIAISASGAVVHFMIVHRVIAASSLALWKHDISNHLCIFASDMLLYAVL